MPTAYHSFVFASAFFALTVNACSSNPSSPDASGDSGSDVVTTFDARADIETSLDADRPDVSADSDASLDADRPDVSADSDASLDADRPDANTPNDAATPMDTMIPTDSPTANDGATPNDSSLPADGGAPASELAFVATYLGGLSVYTLDATTGALALAPGAPFDNGAHYYGVAVDPQVQFAYAIDIDAGDVVGYRVGPGGTLSRLPGAPLHVGGSPVTLTMHPAGRVLYVGLGTPAIAALTIGNDGTLSMPASSATSIDSAPAYLTVDSAGRYLYASHSAAAGVSGFALDATTGALTQLAGSPFLTSATIFGGALAIDPSASVLLNARFALNGMAVGSAGALTLLAGSPFSSDVGADPSATSIVLDATGHFAYAVNSTNGHVLGFSVDAAAGTLTPVPGSPFAVSSAYSIAIDPSGRFVYVSGDSGTIGGFRRDATTGALTPFAGAPVAINGLQPEMVIARLPPTP